MYVEVGYKFNGSLFNEGCVDELLLYFALCLFGDCACGMVDLFELVVLDEWCILKINDMCAMGSDIRIMVRLEL